tara:strand:+ start:328 stop:498 length:171 start_codon:yes stop_codon:yes gene_type:complete
MNKEIDNIINNLKEMEENLAIAETIFGQKIYETRHKMFSLMDKLENLDTKKGNKNE